MTDFIKVFLLLAGVGLFFWALFFLSAILGVFGMILFEIALGVAIIVSAIKFFRRN